MGYVNVGVPKLAKATVRNAVLYSADGGVDYSFDGMLIDDDKASDIKNMWLKNGILTVRDTPCGDSLIEFAGRCFNSLTDFAGYSVIHMGSQLYRLAEDGAEQIFDGLPDKKSIPVQFSGKLYIYCDARVFSVTRDFSVKEEMPYAPLYSIYDSPGAVYPEIVTDFKANVLAPYISVQYKTAATISESTSFNLRERWDSSKMYEIYLNGEKNDECVPIVNEEGDKFRLTGNVDFKGVTTVEIRFYSKDEQFDYIGKLTDCTVGTAFGGGTLDGTRVILAGNSNYPGKYFSSALGNALYFTPDSGGEVGCGNEDITGFSLQSGYLMVFTSGTVSRMSYGYTEEGGGYYSLKTVSTDVGCDAPLSIALVDNKTVFASSANGIYIVDTNEIYDSLNIVPISANITDENGKEGWFSLTDEERKGASHCIHERKYILCTGKRTFIWDFGAGVYTSSSDHIRSARKLKWFEFYTDKCLRIVSSRRKLFALMASDDGGSGLYAFGDEGKNDTDAFYMSKLMDFGQPHIRKSVNRFKCGCKTDKETNVTLEFYADGELYRRVVTRIVPDKEGYAEINLKVPGQYLTYFAYGMRTSCSGVGFFNTAIEYTLLKDNLME